MPTQHGTMAALARTYLRSGAFASLAPPTQRARRHLVEHYIIGKFGPLPVIGLRRKHIIKIMDSLAATPGTARNVLSTLRILIRVAMDDEIIEEDPTTRIKTPQAKQRGLARLD